ncbi:PRAME family member 8-like [Capricornis sumatraensis]|uniref:PRAME family member 8-like n=1 Tax=Capricornis sumatraensis TaxID=34865 RepID=UPI003604AB9C
MNVPTPPRLLDLARTNLLRDEDTVISALEFLPMELFPPLFVEAFQGRHIETLKAMVQTWPFVRLPLGALIDLPHVGPLQAVLEALDVLLAQKVPCQVILKVTRSEDSERTRNESEMEESQSESEEGKTAGDISNLKLQQKRAVRCKLRVLDLRDTDHKFWIMWSGANDRGCTSSGRAPVIEPSSITKQHLAPLRVFTELSLKKRTLNNFLTYLLRWVEQRKASIHLCCKKLKIFSMSMENIVKVLSLVQLDCIQEVQVNCTWHLSTLATFAPFLGRMSNLQRLVLFPIHVSAFRKHEQDHIVQITSQFLRLGHLRDLHLDSPSFLEGCLDQMLRCLKTTLHNLSITKCRLTESDLIHLSQCPNICQLKSLEMIGVTMTDFSPELLQVLLEKVAATIQELYLDQCGIMDSQFEAILPALSRCSQLSSFSLCGNLLSMAVMEKMLRHTAGLSCLSQEWYPAPQESYSPQGVPLEGRLAHLRTQLLEILRDSGQPRIIRIFLSPCPHNGDDLCHHVEPIIYSYSTPA